MIQPLRGQIVLPVSMRDARRMCAALSGVERLETEVRKWLGGSYNKPGGM